MSKSLKNFITIKDFLQEGHSPNDLRWFCLQNHYRAHVEFGPDRVENARSTHQKVTHLWEECAYRRQAHPVRTVMFLSPPSLTVSDRQSRALSIGTRHQGKIVISLDNTSTHATPSVVLWPMTLIPPRPYNRCFLS